MSNAIKVYTHLDVGAPVLTGQLGKMIDLLDAVLVNGYGAVSITSITRSGAVATVNTTGPHNFSTGDSGTISGANEVDYNGDFVVTVISTTAFTFAVANSPATPATGTLSVKRSSAGFSKAFTGSNVAAYRSNDVTGIRHYLQVRDDATGAAGNREAFFRGYEVMTSAVLGTNPFPTAAQNTNAYMISKSSTSDATARPWTIITDGILFYIWVQYAGNASTAMTNTSIYTAMFGDIKSYKVGDTYSSVVGGAISENTATNFNGGLATVVNTIPTTSVWGTSTGLCCARDFTGSGSAKLQSIIASAQGTAMSASIQAQYPNPVDGGLYIVPVSVVQGLPSAIRGTLPGVYESLHGVNTHVTGDTLSNVNGLSGRKLRWMPSTSASTNSGAFIDVTGPWR